MATIYEKLVTDKTLILEPREGIIRQFDFGLWTEMRIGMYYCGIGTSGDNVTSVSETVAQSTNADRITFGIKNNSTDDLPGFTGARFLGTATRNGIGSECNTGGFFTQSSTMMPAIGMYDTTIYGGTSGDPLNNALLYPTGAAVAGATGYNGVYCLRFVVNNAGLATQTVTMSNFQSTTVSGSNYSINALRTAINNGPYIGSSAIQWNDGAAAYALPDAFFCRMPFYNNRIRISAMMTIRYA